MGGLVAGLTLTLIHLISIPVDNTSVNPVRSLATALFADPDFEALQQLWAFIVFPLIGAVVGVVVFLMLDDARLEDTMLAEVPGLVEARDSFEIGTGEIVHSVEDALDTDDDDRPEHGVPDGQRARVTARRLRRRSRPAGRLAASVRVVALADGCAGPATPPGPAPGCPDRWPSCPARSAG